MTSLSRAVDDFRHHSHKDLDEEFQKERDFVEEYTPLNYQGDIWELHQNGVALAVNDFSSGIMSASAGDDNSTKELKGFKKPKMIQRKYTIQFQKLQKSTSSLQVFS
ncbi:uncharacterized protein LOC113668813 [Pocillopora damicornis]|uniref:uncharacterized protein LOC113668813 n=1 Tax=Pocillopora damicornis TaxID=46731 RepID=UPI000F54FEC9|nr:uncharacterized protein LOC113668813 [Pocillopora damicornis]